jgi:DNA-binding response OmpR family regulator
MLPGSEDAPRLLMVEDDWSLRSLFTDLLTAEGYALTFASSLEEAMRLADGRAFALILVDLFVGHPAPDLPRLCALRARSFPVPLAVLTYLPLPDLAHLVEVAFVLPMPFDIDACLSLIATTLRAPRKEAQTLFPSASVAAHMQELSTHPPSW